MTQIDEDGKLCSSPKRWFLVNYFLLLDAIARGNQAMINEVCEGNLAEAFKYGLNELFY